MPTLVQPTGNPYIDGLLWGWKWDTTSLTVSFPTSIQAFQGYVAIEGFQSFTQFQAQQILQFGLNNLSVFSGLDFSFAQDEFGNLRFAQAQRIDYGPNGLSNGLHVPGGIGSAEANPPDGNWVPAYAQGDNWFTLGAYEEPVLGSFQYAAGLLHEVGHSLGLKHGHATQPWSFDENVVFPMLPADANSQEFSVMTYSSYIGASVEGGASGQEEYPWTYMMLDYLALQYLYGANYGPGSNNGDTTYSFNPQTGELTIDGFGFGASYNGKILATLWDGGGRDHMDFSNYDTNQRVTLAPGEFSTFSPDQLSNLSLGRGEVNLARGNIANALLFNGDLRSLIEDVSTGNGNDFAFGNIVSNTITTNGGNDRLFGETFEAENAMDTALQVYRLYQATLDRAPDRAGQADWTFRLVSESASLPDVAGGFVGSREFQNVYGALDDSGFVNLLYQNVLNRAADQGGLNFWLNKLATGSSRPDVVLGFSESREFIANTTAQGEAFTRRASQADWSDEVFRVYQATLDRDPDSGGFFNWTNALAGGRALSEVVSGFVGSQEFQNTYGSVNNTQFVQLLYQNVLNRAADQGGLTFWLNRLATGSTRSDVVLGFSESQEFINGSAPGLESWMRGLTDKTDRLVSGSGNDVLAGGLFADVFVFGSGDAGTDHVTDLEAWDTLQFNGFGFADDAAARARMVQQGADVVFQAQGVTVVIEDTQLSHISDSMILV